MTQWAARKFSRPWSGKARWSRKRRRLWRFGRFSDMWLRRFAILALSFFRVLGLRLSLRFRCRRRLFLFDNRCGKVERSDEDEKCNRQQKPKLFPHKFTPQSR